MRKSGRIRRDPCRGAAEMLEPGRRRAAVREVDHDFDDFRSKRVQVTGLQVLLAPVRHQSVPLGLNLGIRLRA